MFMTSTDLLQLKIHAGEMQLCLVRESNTVFPVVFHMTGGMRTFYIRLFINRSRNKWTSDK